MGAGASSDGALEMRALHNAISASGKASSQSTMNDLLDTHHLARFDHLVDRFLQASSNPQSLTEIERTYGTPLMYCAAKAGGEEILAIVRLIRRACVNDQDFQRALDWRDAAGLTLLHVARDGKVAAVLLRAGCSHLESREFNSQLTPIQLASKQDKVDLVAVLHAWGASDEGPESTATSDSRNATDIALWQTVPERQNGNLCWLCLFDLVPLSRFQGFQWLNSEIIRGILEHAGIRDTLQDKNLNEKFQRPSRLFPEGRENARTVPDAIEIECLPEEFREAAEVYDVDRTGKICLSELKKIVRSKQKVRSFQGDTDILVADNARFNSIGGGDVRIQCRQRNFHEDRQPRLDLDSQMTTTATLSQTPKLDVSRYTVDSKSQTESYYVIAPAVKEAESIVEANGQGEIEQHSLQPAGMSTGVCLRNGAESGETPKWLQLAHTLRSADPRDNYTYKQVTIPIPLEAKSSGWTPPETRSYDGEFDHVLAQSLGNRKKLLARAEHTEDEGCSLWRPSGNR